MINITDKIKCSGCAACEAICPKGCIVMGHDEEGFAYPVTDPTNCIECGLCERACPILNVPKDHSISSVMAVKNKDEQERFNSSSGGVFCLLAEDTLREGGVVVGCRFDDDMKAVHSIAAALDELPPLMSSKYVQSDSRMIYREVKKLLVEGRRVIFSGVPCQVAGLRNFLRKSYDNLLCVDILCHGVPSPRVFRDYLDRLEERYKGKAENVNFRWKERSWKRLHINVKLGNGRRHHLYSGYDSYMQLFLSDRLQRPSCFECPYNTLNRPGDITLGDFWGIGKTNYSFDDNKGASVVIINSEAGHRAWRNIEEATEWFTADIDTAIEGNKVLVQHLPTRKKRDEFYKVFVEEGYDAAIYRFAPETPKGRQMYMNFMRRGLDLIRKIKRESY